MKNTIKMSLAAALAVSALSTTASAGNLEDMIKDTTVSGKLEVGFNMETEKETGENDVSTSEWEYDFDATLNSKVNDTITAQIGIQADHANETRDTNTDADGAQAITLTKLNITAKTDYATMIVGKQGQPTPFLDDDRADGVVALVPVGPITLAAGHFTGMNGGQNLGLSNEQIGAAGDEILGVAAGTVNGLVTAAADNDAVQTILENNDLDSLVSVSGDKKLAISTNLAERDISAIAAIASVGPVNVQAWYLMASGAAATSAVENGVDGYSVAVDGTFGPVSVNAAHASLELDAAAGSQFDAETLTKVGASFDAGVATVFGAYGFTNDASHNVAGAAVNNTRLHGVDLSGDDDAKTNMALEYTKLDAHNDADAILVGASAKLGDTKVTGQYLMATINGHNGDQDTDVTELNLEACYAMSKNFKVSGLYAMQEIETTNYENDNDSIQLSMKYSF
jgi:hypothetical protein